MNVKLMPFPAGLIETSWGWLQEQPRMNFDDYGPRSLDEWVAHLADRSANPNEYLFAVLYADTPVGMVAATRLSPRMAQFHGLCFTRAACGKGIAREAVQHLMLGLIEEGVERFEAAFFADNGRVRRFLKKLGFHDEGWLKARTLRDGKPVDVRLMGYVVGATEAPLELFAVKRGGEA